MASDRNSPKGLTLVELTIAMVLIMIITIPLTIFFGSHIRSYYAESPPPQVHQVLYEAMKEMTVHLRESQEITSATPTSVTFTNSAGATMTFSLNSSQKVVQRTQGASTTFVPYYNSPGANQVYLDLRFNYFSAHNQNWTSGIPADIYAVGIELSGSYDSYLLTLNNLVYLRRKN